MGRMSNRNKKLVKQIFDKSAKDLSYITENSELLRLHIKYINRTAYSVPTASETSFQALTCHGTMKTLMPFEGFFCRYGPIYQRWRHMVRCCYDETYFYYKFFGAKGIKMSMEFLDSKKFCIWCLRNGLTGKAFLYDKYLLRRDKSKNFSSKNCFILTEKDRHECKSIEMALKSLYLIKLYEEEHHPEVQYITFLTRYYLYDLDADDARNFYNDDKETDCRMNFKPSDFYNSVADESSCSMSTFLSRMHYSYLNSNFVPHPYDMLKPEYSVNDECNKQGLISYKQLWNREHQRKNTKDQPSSTDNSEIYSNSDVIYSESSDSVYS